MRHKQAVESKLERIESKLKKVGYYIRMEENGTAYDGIGSILEDIDDIKTLLRTENDEKA